MIGTFNCIYETPCGWCSKWDKKCDTRIPCHSDEMSDMRRPLPSGTVTTTRDELFCLGHTKNNKSSIWFEMR
jgi:hypothetical protein